MATDTFPIPFKRIGDKKFFFLSVLGDTGNLRAATINKSRSIQDEDKHHCCEVNVQGSIRYIPKKWVLN